MTNDISVNCPQPTINNNFNFGIWFVGGVGSNYYNSTQGYFQSTVYAGTASNTNLMSTAGATFDIAKVQVEPGAVATPFQFIPIAQEIKRCMRYYQKSYAYGTTVGTAIDFNGAYGYTWDQARTHYYSTFGCWYTVPFQTRMRTTPTVTIYAPYSGNAGYFSIDQGPYNDKTATVNSASDTSFQAYSASPTNYGYSVEQYYGGYIHYRAICDAAPN